MTNLTERSMGGDHAGGAVPGIAIDAGLVGQWKTVVALSRADRDNVVVLTVAPRARRGTGAERSASDPAAIGGEPR